MSPAKDINNHGYLWESFNHNFLLLSLFCVLFFLYLLKCFPTGACMNRLLFVVNIF